MSCNINITNKTGLLILFCLVLWIPGIQAQEANPNTGSNSAYHNQLFFNRFLINPTFSLVRENKSYINLLHRNQYATFEDNSQNYFLGFSNKLNDHTALGISIYSQWSGVVQEFGFNANYATSVKLGDNSKLTFGTNITYFNEGLDKNRVIAAADDQKILEAKKESKLALQPGMALSIGKFDFGIYAGKLFNYNQTTNSFVTGFDMNGIRASVQYTHTFMATRGLFEDARFMPLLQFGKNENGSLSYVGSMLLDLPNYGWLQTNFDDNYGLSLGLGFNLSRTMSIGYLMEKDIVQEETDFGWNHEISLAYTFKNHTGNIGGYVDNSQDVKVDQIVRNYEEQILRLKAEKNEAINKNKTQPEYDTAISDVAIAKVELKTSKGKKESKRNKKVKLDPQIVADINSLAKQNRLILDELIVRQDSMESVQMAASEKRFEKIVMLLRNDLKFNLKAYIQDLYSEQQMDMASVEKKPETPRAFNKVLVKREIEAEIRKNELADLNTNESTYDATKFDNVILTASETTTESQKSFKAELVDMEAIIETPEIANTFEHKDFMPLPIKVLDQSQFDDVKSGYYVIANVYKNKKYLKAFMNTLTKKGLDAKQFYNKENGLYYVYLADYNFKEDAKTAYVSNLNGKYNDEKWIMQVDNRSAIVDNMYVD